MTESAGCVTALYDCRSKQEYIYRTNRIKEISGGSALLANVYESFFARAEKHNIKINSDWKSGGIFSAERFMESGFDGAVIYEGGGNLYMIYRSREVYIKANRIFSRMLLDTTYSVSLIASCVDTDTKGDFLADRRKLYEENSRIKSTGSVSLPCNVLPITQTDGVTYMPVTEKSEGRSFSQESVLKTKAFEKLSDKGEIYLDKLTPDKGTESLIAVIYADGNAMGKKVKSCTEGKKGYSECAEALRDLSLRTNNSFVDRPIAAIEKMLAEKAGDGTHKYRKVCYPPFFFTNNIVYDVFNTNAFDDVVRNNANKFDEAVSGDFLNTLLTGICSSVADISNFECRPLSDFTGKPKDDETPCCNNWFLNCGVLNYYLKKALNKDISPAAFTGQKNKYVTLIGDKLGIKKRA